MVFMTFWNTSINGKTTLTTHPLYHNKQLKMKDFMLTENQHLVSGQIKKKNTRHTSRGLGYSVSERPASQSYWKYCLHVLGICLWLPHSSCWKGLALCSCFLQESRRITERPRKWMKRISNNFSVNLTKLCNKCHQSKHIMIHTRFIHPCYRYSMK